MSGAVEGVEPTDTEFLRDLAGRLFRTATPAMGFDQGDTDRLYRIARDLTTPPAQSYADGVAEQVTRLRDAYDAVAYWPEKRGDPMTVGGAGFMDLLKLRNLVAELLDDPAAIRLLSQGEKA